MSAERRIDSLEIEVPNRSVSLEIHEESSHGLIPRSRAFDMYDGKRRGVSSKRADCDKFEALAYNRTAEGDQAPS